MLRSGVSKRGLAAGASGGSSLGQRLTGFLVGFAVGTGACYLKVYDEIRTSTEAIEAANKQIAQRLSALEKRK